MIKRPSGQVIFERDWLKGIDLSDKAKGSIQVFIVPEGCEESDFLDEYGRSFFIDTSWALSPYQLGYHPGEKRVVLHNKTGADGVLALGLADGDILKYHEGKILNDIDLPWPTHSVTLRADQYTVDSLCELGEVPITVPI